jgi:hypothetical protein
VFSSKFKFKRFSLQSLAVILLVCVSAVVLSQALNASSECSKEFTTNAQTSVVLACAQNPQNKVSWSTWLLNKSKSSQFHFLDLLELLSREVD